MIEHPLYFHFFSLWVWILNWVQLLLWSFVFYVISAINIQIHPRILLVYHIHRTLFNYSSKLKMIIRCLFTSTFGCNDSHVRTSSINKKGWLLCGKGQKWTLVNGTSILFVLLYLTELKQMFELYWGFNERFWTIYRFVQTGKNLLTLITYPRYPVVFVSRPKLQRFS